MIHHRIARVVIVALVCAAGAAPLAAQSPPPSTDQALARDIFAELVGINTTFHHGNTTPAAKAVARRLLAAGFPAADVQVIGPNGDNENIVARLRGTGKRRPILLLAHLDVVEALRSDWSLDPFTLTERDGYFYGRGTSDIKDMAAIFVATRLEGGHANNALPQMARAIVNCRMLPDDRQDDVVAAIRRAIADTAVALTVVNPAKPSPPSPLVPDVLGPIEQVSAEFFPGAPVVPSMETGATDGLYLRNAGMPVYGVSGVAIDANDVRAHGRDERIRVSAFYTGVDYTYRLVRALAGGRP